MRDAIFLAILFTCLPICFLRPYFGILFFSWISYFNPHMYTWSVAKWVIPPAQLTAIATILGLPFARERNRLMDLQREGLLLAFLWLLFTATTLFSFYPEKAWPQWLKVSKILFMTFLTMVLICDKKKLRYLFLVVAFSFGMLGAKGGIFSLLSGGQHRIYGPAYSFIADNNDLALALNMALPFMFFLARDEENRRLKKYLVAGFILSVISIIFTYSRGGFLTLLGVGFLLLVKSKRKGLAAALAAAAVLAVSIYIPQQWFERMETIKTYEEDGSVQGRFNAWHFAFNLALARPLTGGGFETFQPELFAIYAPRPFDVHDVHSVYFELIGEHGFVVFLVWAALLLSCFSSLRALKSQAGGDPSKFWIANYSHMLEASLCAYLIGGTFLGRAYFDFFYQIVAAVVILKKVASDENELEVSGGINGQMPAERYPVGLSPSISGRPFAGGKRMGLARRDR